MTWPLKAFFLGERKRNKIQYFSAFPNRCSFAKHEKKKNIVKNTTSFRIFFFAPFLHISTAGFIIRNEKLLRIITTLCTHFFVKAVLFSPFNLPPAPSVSQFLVFFQFRYLSRWSKMREPFTNCNFIDYCSPKMSKKLMETFLSSFFGTGFQPLTLKNLRHV